MTVHDKGKRQAEELDASLSVLTPSEVIREMKEKYDNDPGNNEVRFQYACALLKSGGIHAETDKREAISHFDFLVQNGVFVRDSLFNLALTEYFLADYEFARVHCEDLYRQDPDNKQVKQLFAAISYKHQRMLDLEKKDRDTTIGVAVGVGLTIAAVGLGFLLTGGKKK
eukprot:gene7940-9470_t